MKIILDGMGSDNHPQPEIEAAINASLMYKEEIILVGIKDQLLIGLDNALKQKANADQVKVRIVHAPDVIEMTDKPAENARQKAQNSMAVGMDLIRSGEADAFITAGNTGGAMANALFHLGRIRGVKRPGLTALFPIQGGGRAVVLDIGANAECKSEYLLQFAVMGSIYAEKMLGILNPRIGLLSNGEEAGKGNELIHETYPILVESKLNFIGNVEPKELFGGKVDVIITDGFTGNILLKTSESVAKLITAVLKENLMSNISTKIGAFLAKPAFINLKKLLDPAEVGAAPLLGINGLVFVGHGRSDSRALVSAIQVARHAVEVDLLSSMRKAIQERISSKNNIEE